MYKAQPSEDLNKYPILTVFSFKYILDESLFVLNNTLLLLILVFQPEFNDTGAQIDFEVDDHVFQIIFTCSMNHKDGILHELLIDGVNVPQNWEPEDQDGAYT